MTVIKKPKNPMVTIIEDGVTSIHDTSHVLTKAWRILIYQSGLTASDWHTLLTVWQTKIAAFGNPNADTVSRKGNVTQTLSKKSITWNSFLRGLSILGYDKLEIDIRLYKRGKVRKLDTIVVDDLLNESNAPMD